MGIFGKYNLPHIQGTRTSDQGGLSTVPGSPYCSDPSLRPSQDLFGQTKPRSNLRSPSRGNLGAPSDSGNT